MNIPLKNLLCASLVILAGWAGGLSLSKDGVVLCVSGGQVRLETCLDSTCNAPTTPRTETSPRMARGGDMRCVSGCGDCVDLPVGNKAITRPYRVIRVKQCPNSPSGEFLAIRVCDGANAFAATTISSAQNGQEVTTRALPVILRI